ncbi:hypothetical protein J1614_006885 [Plenodomus biglobosus]|nr:hypothetical protein J1614_006885 [Plenodomus biglobosus]
MSIHGNSELYVKLDQGFEYLKWRMQVLDNLDISGVDKLFKHAVPNLQKDHCVTHKLKCDFRQVAAEADAVESCYNQLNSFPTAVVKINSCEHVFHKACLQIWLKSQRDSGPECQAGSCLDCRRVLIADPQRIPTIMQPTLEKIPNRITSMRHQLAEFDDEHPSLKIFQNRLNLIEARHDYFRSLLEDELERNYFR